MPRYRNPFDKGNMYIKFDINFPANNFVDEPKLKVSRVKLFPFLPLFFQPPLCLCLFSSLILFHIRRHYAHNNMHTHTLSHAHILTHTYTHTLSLITSLYTLTSTDTPVQASAYTYSLAHTHSHIHRPRTPAFVHTFIHTHIHVCTRILSQTHKYIESYFMHTLPLILLMQSRYIQECFANSSLQRRLFICFLT